jgi:hypothetical protein
LWPRGLALFGPRPFDALASAAAGCIMVGWMVIDVALIGLGSWLQPAYFVVGLVMIGLACRLQWTESHPVRVSGRQHVHAA